MCQVKPLSKKRGHINKMTMAQCVEKAHSLGATKYKDPGPTASPTHLTWCATAFMKDLGDATAASFEERRFLAMEFARIAMDALDTVPNDRNLARDIRERLGEGQAWYA